MFTTVVLVTGPLWAKPVWGTWWSGDARLTSTLFLWLIILGYLILRQAVEDRAQRARYSRGPRDPGGAADSVHSPQRVSVSHAASAAHRAQAQRAVAAAGDAGHAPDVIRIVRAAVRGARCGHGIGWPPLPTRSGRWRREREVRLMPPDNAGYVYAAYAAAITVYAGYAVSIWWRGRALASASRRRAGRPRSTHPGMMPRDDRTIAVRSISREQARATRACSRCARARCWMTAMPWSTTRWWRRTCSRPARAPRGAR